jgi:hypothetical protein
MKLSLSVAPDTPLAAHSSRNRAVHFGGKSANRCALAPSNRNGYRPMLDWIARSMIASASDCSR